MRHELKIWPQYFCRIADGSKTFEVRKNDRGYQPGDVVVLKEYDPTVITRTQQVGAFDEGYQEERGYTSAKPLEFEVGYVLPIDSERVVFSLLPRTPAQNERIRSNGESMGYLKRP